MNTHQAVSTDPMPRGANHPLQARLGKGRKALLCIAAVFLALSSAPAAQSPAGQVVSWGLVERFPYVRPGTVFTNISCGGTHNIGMTKEGTVITWGGSVYDPPAGLSNVVATAGSEHGGSFALKSDGTLVGWGPHGVLKVPPGLNEVKAVAAGGLHCLALRSNGTVVAWGEGQFGATNIPPGLANVVGISAGGAHSVALKSDGTLAAWGDNYYNQTNVPAGLSNVIQIAAGANNTLALTADGTVRAWGDTNYGVTLVPQGLTGVVQVDCGFGFAVALRGDGTLAYWGQLFPRNHEHTTNLLAGLRDVVEISVSRQNGVARKRDGTFVAWGYTGCQRSVPPLFTDVVSLGSSVPGWHFLNAQAQLMDPLVAPCTGDLTNIAAFADGGWDLLVPDAFTLAARQDGTVVAWGANDFGQLDVPQGLSNVVNVAAGSTYGVALKSDGTVAVWGARTDPEFGETTQITNVPAGLNDVRSVAAGSLAILVVRSNGTLVAWGDDIPVGQPALIDAVAVSIGDSSVFGSGHCLALRSNGTVVAWGYNASGQTNVLPGLSNVVAIAAGLSFSVALKSDGKVVVWGQQGAGENAELIRTVPANIKNVIAISAQNFGTYALVLDPKLSIARHAGSGVALGFRSFLGQRYQIQYSPDLAPGNWFNLPGGDVTGTGADVEVTDSNVLPGQPARFYRLVELD